MLRPPPPQELKALSARIHEHADTLRRQERGDPPRPRSDMPTVDSRRVAREQDDQRYNPPSYPQHDRYPASGGGNGDPYASASDTRGGQGASFGGPGGRGAGGGPGATGHDFAANDPRGGLGDAFDGGPSAGRDGGRRGYGNNSDRGGHGNGYSSGNNNGLGNGEAYPYGDAEVIEPHPRQAGPPARRRRSQMASSFDPAADVLDVSQHALNAVDTIHNSLLEDDDMDAYMSPHVRGLRKLHRVEHNEQVSRVEQEVKNLCDLGLLHQDEELALHVAEEEGRADEVLIRIEACHDPDLVEYVATNGGADASLPHLSRQQLLPLQEAAHSAHLDVAEHNSHPHQPEDLAEFDRTASSMLRASTQRRSPATGPNDSRRAQQHQQQQQRQQQRPQQQQQQHQQQQRQQQRQQVRNAMQTQKASHMIVGEKRLERKKGEHSSVLCPHSAPTLNRNSRPPLCPPHTPRMSQLS